MLFFLNGCNILSTLFVYFSNYRVVRNGEVFVDLRFLIIILLTIFIYKIYVFYVYKVVFNITSLFNIYLDTNLSFFNKLLNYFLILFTMVFFFGFNVICFKVFLIESNLNLEGKIKLFSLLIDDLHLVKIYSSTFKYSLVNNMLFSLDLNLKNILLSDPLFKTKIKEIIITNNSPLELKEALDNYIKTFNSNKEVFYSNNIFYIILASSLVIATTYITYVSFPTETISIIFYKFTGIPNYLRTFFNITSDKSELLGKKIDLPVFGKKLPVFEESSDSDEEEKDKTKFFDITDDITDDINNSINEYQKSIKNFEKEKELIEKPEPVLRKISENKEKGFPSLKKKKSF